MAPAALIPAPTGGPKADGRLYIVKFVTDPDTYCGTWKLPQSPEVSFIFSGFKERYSFILIPYGWPGVMSLNSLCLADNISVGLPFLINIFRDSAKKLCIMYLYRGEVKRLAQDAVAFIDAYLEGSSSTMFFP